MPFDASPLVPPQVQAQSPAQSDPTLKVLAGARAFLEGGWCRGALARDPRGRSVPYASPAAVEFCLAGAVYRAGLEQPRGTMGALLLLMQLAEPLTVADTNDHLLDRPGEAAAFLDRAIELRRAELTVAAD